MELDFKEAAESALYRANNSNMARCYLALEARLATAEQEKEKAVLRASKHLHDLNDKVLIGMRLQEILNQVTKERDELRAEVKRQKEELEQPACVNCHIALNEQISALKAEVEEVKRQRDLSEGHLDLDRADLFAFKSENERLAKIVDAQAANLKERDGRISSYSNALEREIELRTAAQQSAKEQFGAGVQHGMLKAANICRHEQVDAEATGCDTDLAYNRACDDCADAIRQALKEAE